MKKLRIGFDFDDVLVASADHTLKMHNLLYDTHLTRDNWYDDEANFAPWNVDSDAAVIARVVELRARDDFMEVEPLAGAQAILKRLKARGDELLVITGRPAQLRGVTFKLLEKYYDGIFQPESVHFTDHFAHEGARIDKGDIAVQLGLTYFVDDVIQHANSVASKGVTTVLFGENYHWNQTEPDNGVIRIATWKALGEFFDKEAA